MKLNVSDLEVDEEFVLSRRYAPRDRKPPFTMFGNGRLNRVGQSMDIVDTLIKLTPAAAKLFQVMLRVRDVDTNEVRLKPSELESPRVIQNHMPSLIENDVVVRLANCRYLINPSLVVPNHYRGAATRWALAKSGLATEEMLTAGLSPKV